MSSPTTTKNTTATDVTQQVKKNKSPEEFYDDMAGVYDSLIADKRYQVQHFAEGIKLLEQHLEGAKKEGTLLDVGCGTGKLAERLGPGFQYTGIDVSSRSLSRQQKNVGTLSST